MDWLSKKFGTEIFLDGDSADTYKNRSLASSAQTRTMTRPMAAAWIGYQKFSGQIFFDGNSVDSCKNCSLARSAQARAMTMPMAMAWIGHQNFSGPIFSIAILRIPIKTVRMHKLNPNPNDDHAHGSGVDWLSKIFGAEKFWTTIPLIPLKTDRFQDRPKPER